MKKIYIPALNISGAYIEEIGTNSETTLYPGEAFEIAITKEDFADLEEYHAVWISLTKVVQRKLENVTTKQS
jgi:hypothetical protein